MKYFWLGSISYLEALEKQLYFHKEVLEKSAEFKQGCVLGLEHFPVVTLGRRGDFKKDILNYKKLNEKKIKTVLVDRGGQATLHNHGQLVIYPILPIKRLKLSVKQYVSFLEQSVIELCRNFEIEAFLKTHSTGVYTSNGRLGFVGVRLKQGVSYHGLSLNVSNELKPFSWIRSCGVKNAPLDRLSNYGVNLSSEEIWKIWLTKWFEQFELHFLENKFKLQEHFGI